MTYARYLGAPRSSRGRSVADAVFRCRRPRLPDAAMRTTVVVEGLAGRNARLAAASKLPTSVAL
jgi:hypothetical protein